MCYNLFGDLMEHKKLLIIITILIFAILGTIIVLQNDNSNINFNIEGNTAELPYENSNPVVAMKIDGYGTIAFELYYDIAPNTVSNFIYLIINGYYDNNTFHRLMKGFVLQGGDPTGTGSGNPGYTIKGEMTNNGFENNLKHTEGIISMARRSDSYDTAGSQFFIMLDDANYLDGEYAAFGKIIDGMDVIKKIEQNEVVANTKTGKLEYNLTIIKTLIDFNNVEVDEPEFIIIEE